MREKGQDTNEWLISVCHEIKSRNKNDLFLLGIGHFLEGSLVIYSNQIY